MGVLLTVFHVDLVHLKTHPLHGILLRHFEAKLLGFKAGGTKHFVFTPRHIRNPWKLMFPTWFKPIMIFLLFFRRRRHVVYLDPAKHLGWASITIRLVYKSDWLSDICYIFKHYNTHNETIFYEYLLFQMNIFYFIWLWIIYFFIWIFIISFTTYFELSIISCAWKQTH